MQVNNTKKSGAHVYLGKYVSKRKIGRGDLGDVFLVQKEGSEFALKVIDKKKLQGQNEHFLEYLQAEIKCMKEVESQYILKLVDFIEDDEYYYMVLEYCNGGNLINLQAKEPNKVFSLQLATKYLSQVILGLEALHSHGYLHRDIQPQSILLKIINDQKIFKIAGFLFAIEAKNNEGVILGTEKFMSPQIYKQGIESSGEGFSDPQIYGYEVDMWAFGVLFFFMLNMSYPFECNPYWEIDRKYKQLCKQASNFSYSDFVKNSKKKIISNCTEDLEDLFKRMFEVDPKQRITMKQIKKHPVFAHLFPSSDLSDKKLTPSKQIETQMIIKNIGFGGSIKNEQFMEQRSILKLNKSQIDVIAQISEDFAEMCDVLRTPQMLMLTYSLDKYYLMLLKNFSEGLNKSKLSQRYPKLKWSKYITTNEFKQYSGSISDSLFIYSFNFQRLFEKCKPFLAEICAFNPKFSSCFSGEVDNDSFEGSFRDSYLHSTLHTYKILRDTLKNKLYQKGNNVSYLLALIAIAHTYSPSCFEIELAGVIFREYLKEKKESLVQFDFTNLREWLRNSSQQTLSKITIRIVQTLFAT